ncbi:hypothetical protein [Arthrobacter sp. UYCo732]|uniref:hypothetical protein n=1 Tax=Arthrobacter sp. UYCo732 TaxID=3156336 RepID=UPI003397BC44
MTQLPLHKPEPDRVMPLTFPCIWYTLNPNWWPTLGISRISISQECTRDAILVPMGACLHQSGIGSTDGELLAVYVPGSGGAELAGTGTLHA